MSINQIENFKYPDKNWETPKIEGYIYKEDLKLAIEWFTIIETDWDPEIDRILRRLRINEFAEWLID